MRHTRQLRSLPVAAVTFTCLLILAAVALLHHNSTDHPVQPLPSLTARADTWHFSIADQVQDRIDRLPPWAQDQIHPSKQEQSTSRLLAVQTGVAVYYTGNNQGNGCVYVLDELEHASGGGCGNRLPSQPEALTMGYTARAEPCGVVIVLIPDGYTTVDQPQQPAQMLARGSNSVVLLNTGNHPIILNGPGKQPIAIKQLSALTHQPQPIGC